jgi:hypothetical protein
MMGDEIITVMVIKLFSYCKCEGKVHPRTGHEDPERE